MNESREYGASGGCSLFGTFNLRRNTDIASFQSAFDAMCAHLKDKGYLHSWSLWERAYHDGYDAGFPERSVILEMCFVDEAASHANWDYIKSGDEPIRTLHIAVNQQVKDAHFVLCRRVG